MYGLSGFVSSTIDKLEDALRGADNMSLFDAGLMVDQMRPKYEKGCRTRRHPKTNTGAIYSSIYDCVNYLSKYSNFNF